MEDHSFLGNCFLTDPVLNVSKLHESSHNFVNHLI